VRKSGICERRFALLRKTGNRYRSFRSRKILAREIPKAGRFAAGALPDHVKA
jgi:hypothetical protein